MKLSLPTVLPAPLRTTLLASAFVALAAPAALADGGEGYVQGASPSPIVVVSNGSSYTQIGGPDNLSLMARSAAFDRTGAGAESRQTDQFAASGLR